VSVWVKATRPSWRSHSPRRQSYSPKSRSCRSGHLQKAVINERIRPSPVHVRHNHTVEVKYRPEKRRQDARLQRSIKLFHVNNNAFEHRSPVHSTDFGSLVTRPPPLLPHTHTYFARVVHHSMQWSNRESMKRP